MSKETKMGFEGVLWYGAAGSTATTTQLVNARDITFPRMSEKGDTTVRGDGSGPVVNSSRVTAIDFSITFLMLIKSDDTALEALRVAEAAGTPVALRGLDFAAGKGPNMDFILEASQGMPYKGEATIEFTATPTDESGRDPAVALLYC